MKTYTERAACFFAMCSDPTLDLTWKEFLLYWYNWYRYEIALSKRAHAVKDIKKYADKLNNSKNVFALRKSMKNL